MNLILLEWAASSSLLIAAVIILRALPGRRVSARLRYALWAVVLARLLIPVQLFPIFSSPLVTTPAFPVPELTPPAASTAAPLPEQDAPFPVPSYELPEPTHLPDGTYVVYDAVTAYTNRPAAVPPSVGQLFGGVWLAGSLVMAAAFVVSNVRFARRLKQTRTLLRGAACFLCAYTADGLPSPCLFGLIHPAIYVTPEAAADEVMLRHVLAHEYTHFRHHDHIWNVLRSIALALHWWNPLVWLAVVLSRRDCELACDEGALARLGEGERIAYGRTLVSLLTEQPRTGGLFTCATTMTGGQKSVFDRVTRIARAPRRWLWAAVVVVIAAAAACVFAFGTAAAEPEPDPDPFGTPSVEVWVDLDGIPDYNPWPDSAEIRPEYWPGVTFRWTQDAVSAIRDGQETVLYSLGVIISNVYLTDLNGDGYPELCSTLVDGNYKFIVVYDYENGLPYALKGNDGNACFLRVEDDGVSFRNALWAVEQSPGGEELRAGPLVLTADGLSIQTSDEPGPLEDLFFSFPTGDGSGAVRISGFLGGAYVDWSPDTSPSQGQLYFTGNLHDFCPLPGGYTAEAGSAIWTDETRSAVSVTMGVNRASTEPGSASDFFIDFSVEINSGVITRRNVEANTEGEPIDFTGEAMVVMARNMARLLSAAEAYYYTHLPDPDIQLDPVFAMDDLGTCVEITNLGGPYGGFWYPARTNRYSGERTDPYLELSEPQFLGERFMEFYHSCGVRYSPEDSPNLVRLGLYTSNYTVSQYTVDLAAGTAELTDDTPLFPFLDTGTAEPTDNGPLTDREWIDIAQALADLYVQAADYYAEASVLPTEDGPLPFDTAMKLWFGSGAGAWDTILTLHPDGAFEGDYHDTDMGVSGPGYDSTEYVCRFHGRFGDITQVTPASYSMTLEELVIDTGHPIGEEWIEPYSAESDYKVRCISSGPYGLSDRDGQPLDPGAQFMFYTPDAAGYRPTDELYGMYADNPDWDSVMYQFWTWMPNKIGAWGPDTRLGCYGLCTMETGYGFFDLYAWGIL